MRFEESVEIDAPQERVWAVLSDLEAWPQRIETVDELELLTDGPISKGSRVRIKQPKLPEGIWEVTIWDPPSYFEYEQSSGGVRTVAGHRVEDLRNGRSRLILNLEMRGLMVAFVALFFKRMTERYIATEAAAVKHAAENP